MKSGSSAPQNPKQAELSRSLPEWRWLRPRTGHPPHDQMFWGLGFMVMGLGVRVLGLGAGFSL